MGLQVTTKFIEDNSVTDAKIKLTNNGNLKARNFSDSGDINILKVNASDEIEFALLPKFSGNSLLTAGDKGIANGVVV